MSRRLTGVAIALMSVGLAAQTQQPAPQQPAPNPSNLGSDANGNPLRKAVKTGHVSNYDEAKVPPYTLPDPLVTSDGRRVTDAAMWRSRRRPEILRRLTAADPRRLGDQAAALLLAAARTARPGGRVLFVVCSVLRSECEDVIGRVGEVLMPAPFDAPEARQVAGDGQWQFRLLPSTHGTDGYFVASLTPRV